MRGKNQRIQSRKGTTICFLVIFALFIPFAVVFFFLITAQTIKKNKSDRKHDNNIIQPIQSQVTEVVIDNIEAQNSHFAIEEDYISLQNCVNSYSIDGYTSPYTSINIPENSPVIFNSKIITNNIQSITNCQLCFAHHNHQHTFKLKVYPKFQTSTTSLTSTTSNKRNNIDCDIYLSASNVSPSLEYWDWKSNRIGNDSITIHSYADEFQKSQLSSLFISIISKKKDKTFYAENNEKNVNNCVLEIEVSTLNNVELLHKINLRGGRIMLPRDLNKLKNSYNE